MKGENAMNTNFKESDLFATKGLLGKNEKVSFSMKTTLGELGNVLDRLYESEFSDYGEQTIEQDDGSAIILDSPAVCFPAFGLEAYSGTCMECGEDGELYPDWTLTLIHEAGIPLSEGYYVEQDSIPTALHNFLASRGVSSDGDTDLDVEVAAA